MLLSLNFSRLSLDKLLFKAIGREWVAKQVPLEVLASRFSEGLSLFGLLDSFG